VRRTTTETAKDQKTSSRAPAGEEMTHAHASSARWHAEQEANEQKTAYRPRYPRQGGDQLSLCLPKVAKWQLATPLNIAWTVQGARGGRQPPPPTPVDRRRYPTKTKSREEHSLQLSSLLGRVWQPLPQENKGKEDLGAIKGGRGHPLEGIRSDLIFIFFELLVGHAGSSTFGQLELCNQGLVLLVRCRVVIQEGRK
jgi:hypothetical protein